MIAAAVNDALWPPTQTKTLGKARLRRLGEIDDLGHVRQVVAGKRDDIRPPMFDGPQISAVILDLQVDQPNRVPGPTHRLGDELEPERLQPQKHLGVKQRARMDPEKPHRIFLLSLPPRSI